MCHKCIIFKTVYIRIYVVFTTILPNAFYIAGKPRYN